MLISSAARHLPPDRTPCPWWGTRSVGTRSASPRALSAASRRARNPPLFPILPPPLLPHPHSHEAEAERAAALRARIPRRCATSRTPSRADKASRATTPRRSSGACSPNHSHPTGARPAKAHSGLSRGSAPRYHLPRSTKRADARPHGLPHARPRHRLRVALPATPSDRCAAQSGVAGAAACSTALLTSASSRCGAIR